MSHVEARSTSESDACNPPDGNVIALAARKLGLKKTNAWVLEATNKERTTNAESSKRTREKDKTRGFKQLSVTLPEKHHEFVKTLAYRTKAGESLDIILAEIVSSPRPTNAAPVCHSFSLAGLAGWRRWLLSLLLPAESFKS